MCTGTPDVPAPAQRQQAKLPDQGVRTDQLDDRARLRRAMMAGVATSMQGALGNPNVTNPKLGAASGMAT